MEATLNQFSQQINEIAEFAKAIKFDVYNGDITELVRLYVKREQAFYSAENHDLILSIVKNMHS